jgi:hypothetical protein
MSNQVRLIRRPPTIKHTPVTGTLPFHMGSTVSLNTVGISDYIVSLRPAVGGADSSYSTEAVADPPGGCLASLPARLAAAQAAISGGDKAEAMRTA